MYGWMDSEEDEDVHHLHDILSNSDNADLDELRSVLEKDIDVNEEYSGDLPLCMVVSNVDLPAVKLLLEYGATVHMKADSETPLEWAFLWFAKENYAICKLLLDEGADPNVRDQEGQTPQHKAFARSSLNIIRLLLHHGGDIKAVTSDGRTILHCATGNKRLRVLKFALNQGFDIEHRTTGEGLSVLH